MIPEHDPPLLPRANRLFESRKLVLFMISGISVQPKDHRMAAGALHVSDYLLKVREIVTSSSSNRCTVRSVTVRLPTFSSFEEDLSLKFLSVASPSQTIRALQSFVQVALIVPLE